MAIRRRYPQVGLLPYSDRGSTYASEDYQRRLQRHGLTSSMSCRGDCYDNAVMEAFFSTVKTELGERFPRSSNLEVFYNQQRRHSTIGLISPAAYERLARVEPRATYVVADGTRAV